MAWTVAATQSLSGPQSATPSAAGPWVGTTIVQAKHTNGHNRQFGETDFYSPKSSNTVLGKEIPRILRLRRSKELDNYMLFANRRLAGNAEADTRQHISEKCDLPIGSIYLCGTDQLELWFKTFDDIPEKADLDPLDSPFDRKSRRSCRGGPSPSAAPNEP